VLSRDTAYGAVAVAVVLAVLLVTAPATVPATLAAADDSFLPPAVQRGMNVTAYNDRGFSGPGARTALRRLAATGATHAALVPTWYQPDIGSSDIRPDPEKSPTDESLREGIREARAAGLEPVVKPHVDVRDGTFRGLIRPADYDTWFAAYTRMLVHYAEIAQEASAPLFVIGDELTGVQGDRERWPPLIAQIRRVFKGKLTYAANWDPGYKAVPFWNLLDYVGIDEYTPLPTPTDTPTVDELVAAWAPVAQTLRDAHAETGKPVLLTELGYPARRGGTQKPASEDVTKPVDPVGQARAYEAAFRVLRVLPFVAGIYWWDWATDDRSEEPDGGAGSYHPAGKPAERVLRDFSG
jgi:hypothetical protein